MLYVLGLCLLASSALAVDITGNKVPDFEGTFYLMYVWPVEDGYDVEDCTTATYSYYEYSGNVSSVSCECERNNTHIALMTQTASYDRRRVKVFFDVMGINDDWFTAARDKCQCSPEFKRYAWFVAVKLTDNLRLIVQNANMSTHYYLFARQPVPHSELRRAIAQVPQLKNDSPGKFVCEV